MGVPTIDTGPMTIDEFYKFVDAQEDDGKWELIDGEPLLNASPSPVHQFLVKNIVFALTLCERNVPGCSWTVLPGLGVRVSETRRPEPDILVIPRARESADFGRRDRGDPIVVFEILSPSTEQRDRRWKRSAYTSLDSLTHYIVVAQDAVEVAVFARETGFAERRIHDLATAIELPSLGISLPMADIYRDTGLV